MKTIDFIAFLGSKLDSNTNLISELENDIELNKKSVFYKQIIEINQEEIRRLSNEKIVITFLIDYIVKLLKEDGFKIDFSSNYYKDTKNHFSNLLKTHNANEDIVDRKGDKEWIC